MVGSKPNAYLSEEARLEAQRRMLAERYGLLSDDEDSEEETQPSTPTPPPQNSSPPNGVSSNGNSDPLPHANGREPDLAQDDPAPSEAATYGDTSSVHNSDLSIVMAHEESPVPTDTATTDGKQNPTTPRWPGLELIDPGHGNRICARYVYDPIKEKDAVNARDLKVSKIAAYTSQLNDKHDRKISVNDCIITYAVGGHIRAILRNSGVRALLKGHEGQVADIEFLYSQERRLDASSSDCISVLGSVADDGSVYVWKLVRNDDREEDNLTVADAIRVEHPQMTDGRWYRKIAFRPGPNSIIAEKGIGVAMILLDPESADVRVVELVKMNDKMMVRDKFLRAKNEKGEDKDNSETPIDCAAWMSERIIATSRNGQVYLWDADSTLSTCLSKLPRESKTRVNALYAFKEEALVIVADSGREIEVWGSSGFSTDTNSSSFELRQSIMISNDKSSDLFAVSAVDPQEELAILSTVKGSSLFVLHYNNAAQAFDTVTEVPVKSSVLSLCMTRNMRRNTSAAGLATQVVNSEPAEEIGIWCVQPRAIQMIHLPTNDCLPKSFVKPEVYPRMSVKNATRKSEKPVPVTTMAGSSHSQIPHIPTSSSSSHTGSARQGTPSQEARTKVQERSTSSSSAQVRSSAQKPSSSLPRRSMSHDTDLKANPMSSSQQVPSTHVQALSTPTQSSEQAPNGNELAKTIIDAAKRAVATFEQGAAQRSAAEKNKMDRLIDSVTETATTNLERFVNSTMKRILAETLIPGMSKIIADASVSLKENAKIDPKVTEDYFQDALGKANVSNSFVKACKEMERQMSDSVQQSLSTKYDALVSPAIGVVNEAAEDLTTSVELLRKQVSEISVRRKEEQVTDATPEDTKKVIENEIEQGNIDVAFQKALNKEDLALVTWLCQKFEASTFFEKHSLSQDSMICLAQQLGQGLEYDDIQLKVNWLRELMLVLEPDSDGYDAIAEQTVRQLGENVKELRKNKELMVQHEGLEKSLKTLSRLVTSHVQNI